MKKLMLMLLFLPVTIYMMGQNMSDSNSNESKNYDKNEVRLNVAMAIAGLPELNYERYITDNMGLGMAVAISLEKAKDMTIRSMFLPYYRVYFGEKTANGFFIEGNMALVGEKDEKGTYTYDPMNDYYTWKIDGYESTTSFGFGAACGFKFLARNGVTGEVLLGGGRLFGNSLDGGYPRLGICIGKRF